jgi:hypothetical protein
VKLELEPADVEAIARRVAELVGVSPPPPDSSPWLTAREVAERLKVSAQTIHRLSTSAGLPFRSIGPNGESGSTATRWTNGLRPKSRTVTVALPQSAPPRCRHTDDGA